MEVPDSPPQRPHRPQCRPSSPVAAPGARDRVARGARFVTCAAATFVSVAAAHAQGTVGATRPDTVRAPASPLLPNPEVMRGTTSALVTIGSAIEERDRLAQLFGEASADGFLLRTASTRTPPLPARRQTLVFTPLLPELHVVRNSDIPLADNDGALWAGRGASVLVRGGIALRVGRVTAIVAPEIAYARNLGFQSQPAFLTGQLPITGPFAAQWFLPPYGADLPIRFGDQSYALRGFGQSSLSLEAGPVVVGASTENQWWGPGVRNALLMSNAAEGMPHLFLRTARPLRTRIGAVEGRWIVAGMTPSLYFTARDPQRPDTRVLSGAVVTLRPSGDTSFTVGIARAVIRPEGGSPLGRAFDVFVRNENLGSGDSLTTAMRSDQITSLFARWVIPEAGAEIYGEFARVELPRSFRDFLTAPLNTGAFTLGAARAWRALGGTFRGSAEVTNLEQSRYYSDRPPPPDFYTGRAAPAGFTVRGQPLGAAIGPGSQSQWAAFDHYRSGWQVGVFAQRVRHQNDALYRVFVPNAFRHDVSLMGGVRGGMRRAGVDLRATLTYTNRLNYLFQNGSYNALKVGSVDVRNLTLAFSASAAPRPTRAPRPGERVVR